MKSISLHFDQLCRARVARIMFTQGAMLQIYVSMYLIKFGFNLLEFDYHAYLYIGETINSKL